VTAGAEPEAEPTAAVFTPPRPNLGPEPLPDRALSPALMAVLVMAIVLVIALLGLVGLRRARRRGRRGPARPLLPAGPFANRREQMAAWSEAVRVGLSAQLGGGWRARTTEEIAGDAALAEALGPETAAELVRYLALADLAKFDDRQGLQSPLPDADVSPPWLITLVGSLPPSDPAAGARSTIKGK
jgi:hypothetical protein